MSIQRQMLVAFSVIILAAIILVQAIAFLVTQQRFNEYTQEELQEQVNEIARMVSFEYTNAGSWENISFDAPGSLFWSFSAVYWEETTDDFWLAEQEETEPFDEEFSEDTLPLIDQIDWELPFERLLITDLDSKVIFDIGLDYAPGEALEEKFAASATVFNLVSNQPIGKVHLDIDASLADDEANFFLWTTFSITAAGGALTLLIALYVSYRLSRRITQPIAQLIQQTETELKNLDDPLQPATSHNEVERLHSAFSQFVSSIQTQRSLRQRLLGDLTHEINTPLSVMKLEAKGMLDGLQSKEESAHHILNEIDKLKHVVQDLNWIAETDTGNRPLSMSEFDLIALVEQETQRWQATCAEHHINLEFTAHDFSEVIVTADEAKLLQALGNVISNAVHYSQAGGNIHVTINVQEQISISIQDNGIGIDAAYLQHVWERFYRVDASRNKHTGGRGIGLSIVRAVMEAHGGYVQLDSEGLNKGTLVTLTLPLNILS